LHVNGFTRYIQTKHSISHLQRLRQTLKTLKRNTYMRSSTYVYALFHGYC
jgi:hypothetical protein